LLAIAEVKEAAALGRFDYRFNVSDLGRRLISMQRDTACPWCR
jgi:hypothetical protein